MDRSALIIAVTAGAVANSGHHVHVYGEKPETCDKLVSSVQAIVAATIAAEEAYQASLTPPPEPEPVPES